MRPTTQQSLAKRTVGRQSGISSLFLWQQGPWPSQHRKAAEVLAPSLRVLHDRLNALIGIEVIVVAKSP